jgi:general stress protein YciG
MDKPPVDKMIKGNERGLIKRNERNRSTGKKRGASAWTPEQRSEYGRRGGEKKVKKGLAKLTPEKRQEIASKGGKARQEIRIREIQTEVRGR